MRILGVVMAYNEADCVANALLSLAEGALDEIHLFDHGSTDATASVVLPIRRRGFPVHYHHVDRNEVPPTTPRGRQSPAIWQHIGAFIRQRAGSFDWVVWQAADELIRSPDGRLITAGAIEAEVELGTEVIRPLLRDFWITTGDTTGGNGDYLSNVRYYRENALGHCPRAWRIGLTPDPVPIGLHIQDPAIRPLVHPWYGWWPQGTAVSNNRWLLDHYPIRSVAQGRRKILKEREWISPAGRRPYEALRRGKLRRLVRRPETMLHEQRTLPMPGQRGPDR